MARSIRVKTEDGYDILPPGTKVPESGEDVEASDAARALADEQDVDLKDVTGTGSGGRITKADVQKAVR